MCWADQSCVICKIYQATPYFIIILNFNLQLVLGATILRWNPYMLDARIFDWGLGHRKTILSALFHLSLESFKSYGSLCGGWGGGGDVDMEHSVYE